MTSTATERNPRDPARTRQLLLHAAAEAVAAQGPTVSFDVIARSAGVSKGGLLHHFGTKDELFAALAIDAYERFAQQVTARTEASDLAPGRVMRAYIRAVFAALDGDDGAADYWAVEAQLSRVPAVAAAIRANVESWEDRLTADGFDRDAMRLILLAVTGAEVATSVGALPGGEPGTLEQQLLQLTHRVDALKRLL